MKNKIILTLFCVVLSFIFSCKKEAGKGGDATIFGKVLIKDYNSTYTVLQDTYYAQEADVYIIYGNNRSFGDRVRTNYDGTFEFKYLRTGTYTVYAYSKDTTAQTNALIPVIRTVEITKKSQDVEVNEIEVID